MKKYIKLTALIIVLLILKEIDDWNEKRLGTAFPSLLFVYYYKKYIKLFV